MADKKKSTAKGQTKKSKDQHKLGEPWREEKQVINPETGKKETTFIYYN